MNGEAAPQAAKAGQRVARAGRRGSRSCGPFFPPLYGGLYSPVIAISSAASVVPEVMSSRSISEGTLSSGTQETLSDSNSSFGAPIYSAPSARYMAWAESDMPGWGSVRSRNRSGPGHQPGLFLGFPSSCGDGVLAGLERDERIGCPCGGVSRWHIWRGRSADGRETDWHATSKARRNGKRRRLAAPDAAALCSLLAQDKALTRTEVAA